MNTRIPWSRLVAEGAVIVVSILLAFAIDATWAVRAERVREAAVLEGLVRDFERHQAVITASISAFEGRLEAADRLLAYIGPRAEADAPEIERALAVVCMASPVRFQAGTLEALIGSEGLALLRDQELRSHLAAWSQLVTDLEGVNDFVTSEVYGLLDYLRPRYSIQDLDYQAGYQDRSLSGFDIDITNILRDIEFSNNVYQQRYATEVTLAYLYALASAAGDVLSRIEG